MLKQQAPKAYTGFRAAGIRLKEELVPSLEYHRSDAVGPAMEGYHLFDKAHLVVLTEAGLIPREDGIAMLQALRGMEREGIDKVRNEHGGGMHSGEQYLIHQLGEMVGGRIHLGRSSGDMGEVGRRVAMRTLVLELLPLLDRFRAVLLDLADRYADAVMPAYTHGQHAQPTTLGHWFSMWACVFARDFARLAGFHERQDLSPGGAAILTGSDLPIDRHRLAELMGFSAPIPHTMDAILSHDLLLECVAALTIHAANMGRLGEDLMLWSANEIALIEIPDRFCGTSSIMMQKKNPYAPQAMKGLQAEAAGLMGAALVVEKDPTGLAINERRVTENGMWAVFASAKSRLREAIELFPELIVDRERIKDLAGAYWAQATDMATALVKERGMPWRTAHQIVGILVRLSIERRIRPLDVTPALLDEAAIQYTGSPAGLSPGSFKASLDPVAFVERRTMYGGPAPAAARRELAAFRQQLHQDEARANALRERVARRAKALEAAIDKLIG